MFKDLVHFPTPASLLLADLQGASLIQPPSVEVWQPGKTFVTKVDVWSVICNESIQREAERERRFGFCWANAGFWYFPDTTRHWKFILGLSYLLHEFKMGKSELSSIKKYGISWNYPHPETVTTKIHHQDYSIFTKESQKNLHFWQLLGGGVDRKYIYPWGWQSRYVPPCHQKVGIGTEEEVIGMKSVPLGTYSRGIVGCTPIPTYPCGKSLCSGYLWVNNPQESENTINTIYAVRGTPNCPLTTTDVVSPKIASGILA